MPNLSPVREEVDEPGEPGTPPSPRSLASADWSDGFDSRGSSPDVELGRQWAESLDDFDESNLENFAEDDYSFTSASVMADADARSQSDTTSFAAPAAASPLQRPAKHDATGHPDPSQDPGNHLPAMPTPTIPTEDVMALRNILRQPIGPPEGRDEGSSDMKLPPLVLDGSNVTVRRKKARSEALCAPIATHQARNQQKPLLLQNALQQLRDSSWLSHGTIHEILQRLLPSKVKVFEINSREAQQSGWDAWTKAAPYRLASVVRLVLAPLHLEERQHWVLIRLDLTQRRATLYDSMRLDTARYGFEIGAAKAIVTRLGLNWDLDGWEFEVECKVSTHLVMRPADLIHRHRQPNKSESIIAAYSLW